MLKTMKEHRHKGHPTKPGATAEMMKAPPVMEDEQEVTDSQLLLLHISLDAAMAALWTRIEGEEESGNMLLLTESSTVGVSKQLWLGYTGFLYKCAPACSCHFAGSK